MKSLLDTSFESALRVLIFLHVLGEPMDADRLGALDTIVLNAASFGLSDRDLNGSHLLARGELKTRTQLINQALKQLVLRGLVQVKQEQQQLRYELTFSGERFVNRLDTPFSTDLYNETMSVTEQIGYYSTQELTSLIACAAHSGEIS